MSGDLSFLDHDRERCRRCQHCPACGLPMLYAPASDDHGCQSPRCQLAHGLKAMHAVAAAARQLANNIDEFDYVTDSEFLSDLVEAIDVVDPPDVDAATAARETTR